MKLGRPRSFKLVKNWREYLFFLVVIFCSFISFNSPRPQIATIFNWEPTPFKPASVYAQPANSQPSPAIQPPSPSPASAPAVIAHTSGSKNNTYAYGHCTYYVASRRAIPPRWGNAANWYWRAKNIGWKVGHQPAVGAVAWTSAGWAGHVAYVEAVKPGQVLISEMNYNGNLGRRTERWVPSSAFLYIY